MSRKIILPPSDYDGPSLVNPSPAKRNTALIKQVEAHTGHIFEGSRDNFLGSRGKNRTIPVSKFQRQIYHSSDFDNKAWLKAVSGKKNRKIYNSGEIY